MLGRVRSTPLLLGNLEAALNSLAAAITVPFVVPYAVTLGANSTEAGLIIALPLLWLVAAGPYQAVPIWLLNGLAWAAANIANLSLVLAISDERNRASVIAWLAVFQAPADFTAPLIGGILADQVDLPAVFLISAAVRLAAWSVFLRGFPTGEQAASPKGISRTSRWRARLSLVGRLPTDRESSH